MRLMTMLLVMPLLMGATSEIAQYDRDTALSESQAAIGRPLEDFTLRDTSGQSFELGQLRGKPVVVSMIYTSCHHVCPTITLNVQRTVDIAREALGSESFHVITVGFDWKVDTPDRMNIYRRQFGIDDPNWYFLSGDSAAIDGLAANLGFAFYASPKGFDHLSQTTVVDADGLVYRQVYGQDFDVPALVEPLKELVFDTPQSAGVIEHWVDTFLLFCTVYDPNSGRYRFDYSIFMMIIVGVMCLGAIATFIAREWKTAR